MTAPSNSTNEDDNHPDQVIVAVAVCVPIVVVASALAGIFGYLHLQKVHKKIAGLEMSVQQMNENQQNNDRPADTERPLVKEQIKVRDLESGFVSPHRDLNAGFISPQSGLTRVPSSADTEDEKRYAVKLPPLMPRKKDDKIMDAIRESEYSYGDDINDRQSLSASK